MPKIDHKLKKFFLPIIMLLFILLFLHGNYLSMSQSPDNVIYPILHVWHVSVITGIGWIYENPWHFLSGVYWNGPTSEQTSTGPFNLQYVHWQQRQVKKPPHAHWNNSGYSRELSQTGGPDSLARWWITWWQCQ